MRIISDQVQIGRAVITPGEQERERDKRGGEKGQRRGEEEVEGEEGQIGRGEEEYCI